MKNNNAIIIIQNKMNSDCWGFELETVIRFYKMFYFKCWSYFGFEWIKQFPDTSLVFFQSKIGLTFSWIALWARLCSLICFLAANFGENICYHFCGGTKFRIGIEFHRTVLNLWQDRQVTIYNCIHYIGVN